MVSTHSDGQNTLAPPGYLNDKWIKSQYSKIHFTTDTLYFIHNSIKHSKTILRHLLFHFLCHNLLDHQNNCICTEFSKVFIFSAVSSCDERLGQPTGGYYLFY